MRRQLMWLLLVVTMLMPALVGAVTEADFEAKTTQHLLNLCTASPNDPRYRDAIHFCEVLSWSSPFVSDSASYHLPVPRMGHPSGIPDAAALPLSCVAGLRWRDTPG